MGAGQSGPKVTSQDRAILDLKLQRDKLRQYQKRIEVVLEGERQAARASLRAGNKERALLALRRRKYQESLLSQTDKQLATLQELTSSIEFSLVEKDVLYGLRQGTAVLKELNKEMSIESVEKLMDETAEAVAYQREVDEMLQSRMSVEDEEAVQAELAAMEAEQTRAKEGPREQKTVLPDVPASDIPAVREEEQDERQSQPEQERTAERRTALLA